VSAINVDKMTKYSFNCKELRLIANVFNLFNLTFIGYFQNGINWVHSRRQSAADTVS